MISLVHVIEVALGVVLSNVLMVAGQLFFEIWRDNGSEKD